MLILAFRSLLLWVLASCGLVGRCQPVIPPWLTHSFRRLPATLYNPSDSQHCYFSPEDGDSTSLLNVGIYRPVHTAPEPKWHHYRHHLKTSNFAVWMWLTIAIDAYFFAHFLLRTLHKQSAFWHTSSVELVLKEDIHHSVSKIFNIVVFALKCVKYLQVGRSMPLDRTLLPNANIFF